MLLAMHVPAEYLVISFTHGARTSVHKTSNNVNGSSWWVTSLVLLYLFKLNYFVVIYKSLMWDEHSYSTAILLKS